MICGLEVPDFEQNVAAHFDGQEVDFLWVNVGEGFDAAWPFLEVAESERLCLLDEDRQLYQSYALEEQDALVDPYPLYVVVDREGVITWLSLGADHADLRDAIQRALDG